MRKNFLFAAMAALLGLMATTPAVAGNPNGKFQAKIMVSAVLPDGKISDVKTDLIPLPYPTQTKADNNVVPTIAIEYFATPNLSIETICCVTKHKVHGRDAVHGAELLTNGHIIPATVTVKLHQEIGAGIKPYVGLGPTVFFFIDEKPGADLRALGADKVHLKNKLGLALQAGVDVPLGDSGFGVSLDAKRYFVRTGLRVRDAAGATILHSRHKLDPWVLSGGLYLRF